MPTVSVIIPTYNRAGLIGRAIDSVLAQTYQDLEVIVVDDGSTDCTGELLLEKYEGKIKYMQQGNRGVSSARNRGIKEASSGYIAFLDTDDLWFPKKLELEVEAMISHPEVGLIFTDEEVFNESGTIRISRAHSQFAQEKGSLRYQILQKEINDGSQLKGDIYKEMILNDFVCTSTVLTKKEYLQEVGCFNEDLPISEDYDLWLRLARRYPFLYINTVTTRYRIMPEGLSGPENVRNHKYREWDARMLEIHLRSSSPEYASLIKKRIWESYKSAAWGYLDIDLKKTRELSIRSLIYNKFQSKLYLYILLSFLPASLINLIKKLRHLYPKVLGRLKND